LGQSLNSLRDEDKLAAAWPVACGKTMAGRAEVMNYDEGILRIQVEDKAWLQQFTAMREHLAGEITKISGVRVGEIHFEMKR
jgi:predicted nucleic acid-binding Zn ribbon protein